jgi:hypothetical protein
MTFLAIDAKIYKKGRALFSFRVTVQKKEAIVSDARKRCCSKKFQNSKTKKAKVEFPMDKPKAVKTKHNDVGQKEVVVDGRCAAQPFLHKG